MSYRVHYNKRDNYIADQTNRYGFIIKLLIFHKAARVDVGKLVIDGKGKYSLRYRVVCSHLYHVRLYFFRLNSFKLREFVRGSGLNADEYISYADTILLKTFFYVRNMIAVLY